MESQDHFQESPRLPSEELCVAKSFSLPRKLIAAIRTRATHLGISMSGYIAALVHNDLARGEGAPLLIDAAGAKGQPSKPRGVVVPGFELD
jgi:hypothetical protein